MFEPASESQDLPNPLVGVASVNNGAVPDAEVVAVEYGSEQTAYLALIIAGMALALSLYALMVKR